MYEDYTEVAPGLFVGANPGEYVSDVFADLDVTVVVCLTTTADANPVPPVGVLWAKLPLEDVAHPTVTPAVWGTMRMAQMLWHAGQRVLVNCQAGLNRSAWFAAAIITGEFGGPEAELERGRIAVARARKLAPA